MANATISLYTNQLKLVVYSYNVNCIVKKMFTSGGPILLSNLNFSVYERVTPRKQCTENYQFIVEIIIKRRLVDHS